MNIRSIKKRNQLRLTRSVGRRWSSAALALPVYPQQINDYHDWLRDQLIKAFYLPLVESVPKTDVVSKFEELANEAVVKPTFDALMSKEHL